MIVATRDLAGLSGLVTMVDGGFDPIHPGHVEYFAAAAALGAPVLCNISSDDWVDQKHPPLLAQRERAAVIDALRPVDYTHLSSISTVEVLRALQPRRFAKGIDWRNRLPTDEGAICAELGIEVVFLNTVTGSSTNILERYDRARAARP